MLMTLPQPIVNSRHSLIQGSITAPSPVEQAAAVAQPNEALLQERSLTEPHFSGLGRSSMRTALLALLGLGFISGCGKAPEKPKVPTPIEQASIRILSYQGELAPAFEKMKAFDKVPIDEREQVMKETLNGLTKYLIRLQMEVGNHPFSPEELAAINTAAEERFNAVAEPGKKWDQKDPAAVITSTLNAIKTVGDCNPAEMKALEAFLEEIKLSSDWKDLDKCYEKAVQVFSQRIPDKNQRLATESTLLSAGKTFYKQAAPEVKSQENFTEWVRWGLRLAGIVAVIFLISRILATGKISDLQKDVREIKDKLNQKPKA